MRTVSARLAAVRGGLGAVRGGLGAAVRARPFFFVLLTAGLLSLHLVLPPLVLSVTRKPPDYASVNPWLVNLPRFLAWSEIPFGTRIGKTWNLALFWISASSPYGTEWGFAVDVGDLVRMIGASLLVAAYFVLWRYRGGGVSGGGWRSTTTGRAGFVGAGISVLGLTSGPCSVMGCGAPIIPVIGLAFAGLSSTTLGFLKDFSAWSTLAVMMAMATGVLYLGWAAGATARVRADASRRPA